MNYAEIGSRVRSKRKEVKMNQKALASVLQVSQPEMSNIEKGKRPFSKERLQLLATTLNCSVSWLETGAVPNSTAVAAG